jgi:hypothetical protein
MQWQLGYVRVTLDAQPWTDKIERIGHEYPLVIGNQ